MHLSCFSPCCAPLRPISPRAVHLSYPPLAFAAIERFHTHCVQLCNQFTVSFTACCGQLCNQFTAAVPKQASAFKLESIRIHVRICAHQLTTRRHVSCPDFCCISTASSESDNVPKPCDHRNIRAAGGRAAGRRLFWLEHRRDPSSDPFKETDHPHCASRDTATNANSE